MQYLTTRKPRNPLPPPGCYQGGIYSDMSRTYRRNPGPTYMRKPRGKRAVRAALEGDTDDLLRHPNRRAIPPDAWDDLTVSIFRGQRWHRAWKAWYRAPIGTPMPPDYS